MGRLGETRDVSGVESETTTVGLYDVSTVARIAPHLTDDADNICSKGSPAWALKTKSNDRFLVLASCTDLSVFTLGETTEYFFNTSLGGNITDFEILGSSAFCVAVIDKQNIIVLSLEKQTVYFNGPVPCEIDFLFCNSTPAICSLTFGSRSGEWLSVTMQGDMAASKENNRLENKDTEQIQEYFLRVMQKTTTKDINMKGVSDSITQITNGPMQSFVGVQEKSGLQWCGLGSTVFTQIAEEKSWMRVRDGGRFALKLDCDGYIHIFDPLTLCFYDEFDVKKNPDDKILDFVVIDSNEVEVPKLFAIISTNKSGKTQMTVYDRTKHENCFSLPSVPSTTLFAYGGSDRVLMAVEEQEGDSSATDQIVVRQVSQSRPEMRFEALLKSNRFEEAEKFAKAFNLDLQKVYKSHVYYLMDRCDDDDEAFETLMRTMEAITDNNMVAETYFTLVGMSRRCDRIRTYLRNAKKRRISDLDVLKLIDTVCKTWGTYRIIAGPEESDANATRITERVWDLFVEALHGGDPWIELYNEFVTESQFTRARTIFARHGQPIIDYLSTEDEENQTLRFEGLFQLFHNSISTDIGNWSSVIEHITADLLPACLTCNKDIIPRLENLISTLIHLLEFRDSVNWPDNAIKAASSYETMVKVLADNGTSPAAQGLLLFCGSKLTSASANDGSSSMSRMKKVFYDLKELKRLKEVYECSISFSVFKILTAEGICHKILQIALANPNMTHAKIEKFVKPYMAEKNLNQEQTIVNYIQMMSGAAVSNANIFGWEKQCVQLCASLSDETRRCCSIISIASSAKIPWPIELSEAVDKILSSRTLSRSEIEEMQMVCKRTELVKMLASYGCGRPEMEQLTLPNADMDINLTIRCMLAQTEKPSRFVDSIKLVELLKDMQTANVRINVDFIQSLAVITMMSHGDVTTSIINYIDSLSERERIKTISLVFSFIEQVADTPATGENVLVREQMLGVGEELLSYYVCRDNNYDDPKRMLKEDLKLLKEVQKDQKAAVLISDFKNSTWQMEFLQKMLEADVPLSVKLSKCNYMGIPVEHLIEMLLNKAMNENDMEKIVTSISVYVDCIQPWAEPTREMLDPIPQLISWITFRLPELSIDETDPVRADNIAFVIKRLGRVVRETIRKFPFEIIHDDLAYLLQLDAFFNLGEYIIKQSLRGQENESEKQETFDTDDITVIPSTSTASPSTSDLRISGFKRSLGTYDFSGDPALFEGVSAVLAFAKVAPSVARPFESAISEDDATDFRSNWEQLNMFFSLHQQDLLDISARVFAGSLKCYSGEWRQAVVEMENSVKNVVERMLQQKKFDFWHAVTLLSGIPGDKIDRLVMELQRTPGVKSSTKATIRYLQLAFIMCLATGNFEKTQMIVVWYEQKFLVKKLAEEGIRANIQAADFVDKVIQQATELRQPLAPYKLYGYVKKYVEKFQRSSKTTVGEYMVRYATLLIRKASAAGKMADQETRKEDIAKFITLARTALGIAEEEKATCLCSYLRSLFYVLCPYNFEVIQFVVTYFGTLATETDDVDFYKNLQSIMSFLWSYKRKNHVSKEESIWFTKRESILVKDEKDFEKTSRFVEPFGFSLRQAYENEGLGMSDTINSDSAFATDAMVYEKNSVIISDMPQLAMQHLPFHAFLLRKKEDTDETVMAIVKAELSIFNVPIWQAYLREVSWLATRFSRSQLLSSAIFAHANKYAMYGKSLPAGERETIFHLLNSTSQRRMVISTIALLFKKIILSDVKIELLQMGVDISEQWISDLSEEEREEMQEQCSRLKDGIAKFTTELELKKHGLYNEKTADNIENVEELCALIYDEMIEWANTTDVAKKCKVVETIAKANELNLAALHEKLVFAWIEGNESSVIPMSHVDMNESIGGTSFMDQKMEDSQDKDEMRMPLFDAVLDKMVILCLQVDKKRLLSKLVGILGKGGRKATGGYTAVVRATCIILRAFTDEELSAFKEELSPVNLCGALEVDLYHRLFDQAEVKNEGNTESFQLIKTLLQCPSRSHPMTALLACLIIDHEYKDPKSIEQVMTRLQISKQWNTLRALLNYVRVANLDSMIRSFPLLWFRVYENALNEVNGGPVANPEWNYEQCVMLRKWTLWAMGSNVEGGRQPNITRFLRELSCPAAASVVSVLSNWTVEKMDEVDTNKQDVQRDICFEWNNSGSNGSTA